MRVRGLEHLGGASCSRSLREGRRTMIQQATGAIDLQGMGIRRQGYPRLEPAGDDRRGILGKISRGVFSGCAPTDPIEANNARQLANLALADLHIICSVLHQNRASMITTLILRLG